MFGPADLFSCSLEHFDATSSSAVVKVAIGSERGKENISWNVTPFLGKHTSKTV